MAYYDTWRIVKSNYFSLKCCLKIEKQKVVEWCKICGVKLFTMNSYLLAIIFDGCPLHNCENR